VDITTTAPIPEGDGTLAELTTELPLGLDALGGDTPSRRRRPRTAHQHLQLPQSPVADGAAAAALDPIFHQLLAANVGTLPDGSLNLERVELPPLFTADDDFLQQLLRGEIDPATGLVADPSPPFALYPANLNHIATDGNPFASLELP
jgi:hypothetical protein